LFWYQNVATLSPPLNQAKIGGFGGLQFLEKGDEGIAGFQKSKGDLFLWPLIFD
jgi:hypothetical protein